MRMVKSALFIGVMVFALEARLMPGLIPEARAYQLDCGGWANGDMGVTYYNGATYQHANVALAAEIWNDMPAFVYLFAISDQLQAKIVVYNTDSPRWDPAATSPLRCDATGKIVGSSSDCVITQVCININWVTANSLPRDEQTGIATHEFGHALGLNHTCIEVSLMYGGTCGGKMVFSSRAYTEHGIFVPVVDDIRGLAALYGWVGEMRFDSKAWTSPSASEPSSFTPPVVLQVLAPSSGIYSQVVSSTALPGSGIVVMMAYVTPLTLYRFHMGWELIVNNPTITDKRFATIELDDDGIKLVTLWSVTSFVSSSARNTSYFLELVVEQAENGATDRVKATAYAFAGSMQTPIGGETFLGYANTGPICGGYHCSTFLNWADAQDFDAAVWTDSSSNPASYYALNHFWNFQGVILKLLASFTYSPATPIPGVTCVLFTSTTRGGWEPFSYSWTFGDGSTTTCSGSLTGSSVGHVYQSAGFYTARLTVTDSPPLGASVSSTYQAISVYSGGGCGCRLDGPTGG